MSDGRPWPRQVRDALVPMSIDRVIDALLGPAEVPSYVELILGCGAVVAGTLRGRSDGPTPTLLIVAVNDRASDDVRVTYVPQSSVAALTILSAAAAIEGLSGGALMPADAREPPSPLALRRRLIDCSARAGLVSIEAASPAFFDDGAKRLAMTDAADAVVEALAELTRDGTGRAAVTAAFDRVALDPTGSSVDARIAGRTLTLTFARPPTAKSLADRIASLI